MKKSVAEGGQGVCLCLGGLFGILYIIWGPESPRKENKGHTLGYRWYLQPHCTPNK